MIAGKYIGAGQLTVAATIVVVRETSKAWKVTLQDENGAAFDTTANGGYTIVAQMRKDLDEDPLTVPPIATWAASVGGASNEEVTLRLNGTETVMAAGEYFTDIRLINQVDTTDIRRPKLAASSTDTPGSHIVRVLVQAKVTDT